MPMLYSEAFNNKSIIPLKDDNSSGLKTEAPQHHHIQPEIQHQNLNTEKQNYDTPEYNDLLKQYKDLENKVNIMKNVENNKSEIESFKIKSKNFGSNNGESNINELLLIGCGGLLTLLLIEMVYHL